MTGPLPPPLRMPSADDEHIHNVHGEIPIQTSKPCTVHTKHVPASHINEQHHIWPLGKGGPSTEDNMVVVCATGHNNVHQLLRLYQLYGGNVPYAETRRFSFEERKLAKLGWDRICRGAM